MLVDTHCHVFSEYYDNIDKVMEDISNNNISFVINNACNLKTSIEVLELSSKYHGMYCVIGVHPEENYEEVDDVLNLVINNLDNKNLIGIGEIGLDYYYEKDRKEEQKVLFEKQLKFAQQHNLPVIIHSREATKDTIDILKKYKVKGIIHCFNGSLEVAKEYIRLGFKIGINGVVTFKNCKLIEVIKELSINDIVFETDSPYMTPVPFRGKINYPYYVNNVIDFVSEKLDISRDELIMASYNNIKEIFDIKF